MALVPSGLFVFQYELTVDDLPKALAHRSPFSLLPPFCVKVVGLMTPPPTVWPAGST